MAKLTSDMAVNAAYRLVSRRASRIGSAVIRFGHHQPPESSASYDERRE
jgi:hypothetical protein